MGKYFFYLLLSGILLTPLAGLGAETQESFQASYDAAEAARVAADALGYEWRDTAELLEQAKAAAEQSHFDEAVQLADMAKFQSDRAAEQAEIQAKIWQEAVPK
jgi:hypothetical protein